MKIIDDRDQRTRKRKKAKDKLDRAITLSANPLVSNKAVTLSVNKSNDDVRLLDEGSIVTADGTLDLYIKKGVIKKFVNGKNKKLTPRYLYGDIAEDYFKDPDEPMNLTDDYVGSINIGHKDFATNPDGIVGEWTKEDLSVVKNDNGRMGLNVNVRLNPLHPRVQALEVQGIPVGVSVEMWLHLDEKATEEVTEERKEYSPIVDEIFISDFAIVGECGNVGSSETIDFEGGSMDEKITTEEVTEDIETVEVETEETEPTEETISSDDENEESTEGGEEDNEEDNADEDEAEEGEIEESMDQDTFSVVLDEIKSLRGLVEELKGKVESLTNDNAVLVQENETIKKTNRKLSNKLKAKAEADKEFMDKFQGLEVSLGEKKEETKEVVTDKLYANGNGRGEL